jgi:hypothetical protein
MAAVEVKSYGAMEQILPTGQQAGIPVATII